MPDHEDKTSGKHEDKTSGKSLES